MPETEFTGAVLMCPVCVSTVDATKWGWQEYECPSCGTEFTVNLKPDVVAEHAMVG
jgi:transposase-like protein